MTTVLPEMIPEEAVTALEEAFAGGPVCNVDFRIALAKVLTAWKGKSFDVRHNSLSRTTRSSLILPLVEPSDV